MNDPGTKDIFPEFSGSFGGAAKFYILVKGSGVTGTKYGLVLKSDKGIITKQPSDCATALGKEATFSAEASGYSSFGKMNNIEGRKYLEFQNRGNTVEPNYSGMAQQDIKNLNYSDSKVLEYQASERITYERRFLLKI